MVPREENFPPGRISTRRLKRDRRLGESSFTRQKQLGTRHKCLPVDKSDSRSVLNRSIRRPYKLSNRHIHELVSRSGRNRNKRVTSPVAWQEGVCVSSVLSDQSMHSENSIGAMRDSAGDSCVADASLVSPSSEHVDQASSVTSGDRNASNLPDRGNSSPGAESNITTNRLEVIGGRYESIGLSENVRSLILGSCRNGTNRAYQSAWSKWVGWCRERQITPFSASLSQFLEYLSWLCENNFEYRTINVHRSAISTVLTHVDGTPMGQHFLTSKLMKGIYNKIPPKPKYQQIWDLDKVLSYLNSLETNDKLHIKVLSKKLAFLLAVVSPKRVSEISRLNTEFMKYSDTGVIFELPGLSKTQSSSKPKQVKYDAYPENPQLCVVSCIKTYCARTESKRDNSNRGHLLIMNRKPYASISAQTVSHWIRDIMGLAGIDTSKFKAHSARAASTSKASNAGVPIEEILSMADWSSQSTFVKFYRKVVTPHSYGKSVLRTCK
ncbi:hypothetical protein FSP39_010166 [Pinctada imbricata]|uniref:Tyr recombinase domain-containing protein n=1 Tax=Pinctada imbricata TaxID=66713 RepID=A0AA89BW51_PINIB|nr:hypothetical protein FSP39_010166 [Pinctada imbricata]